jgi:hypothetical protein
MRRRQRRVAKPRGRPTGWRKMPTEELKAALLDHAAPSSRWSEKTDKPMLALKGSKRRIHEKSNVSDVIAYSTMCKRLRLGAEGFGKGSRRVDDCDICVRFDNEFCKRVTERLREIKDAIRREDFGFFTVWEAEVKLDESFKKPSFIPAGSLRYLDRLRDFIHLHGSAHVNIMLVGLAVESCAALDALRAEAHGYQCHFHVKDTMEFIYGKDKNEPEENTLYWAMDQKD